MATAKDEGSGLSLVRLDAVAAVVPRFRSLGRRRNSFRAGIYRARRPPGVRGAVQRRSASVAADLFLSAPSSSSIRAVEFAVDRVWVRGVAKKQERLDWVS